MDLAGIAGVTLRTRCCGIFVAIGNSDDPIRTLIHEAGHVGEFTSHVTVDHGLIYEAAAGGRYGRTTDPVVRDLIDKGLALLLNHASGADVALIKAAISRWRAMPPNPKGLQIMTTVKASQRAALGDNPLVELIRMYRDQDSLPANYFLKGSGKLAEASYEMIETPPIIVAEAIGLLAHLDSNGSAILKATDNSASSGTCDTDLACQFSSSTATGAAARETLIFGQVHRVTVKDSEGGTMTLTTTAASRQGGSLNQTIDIDFDAGVGGDTFTIYQFFGEEYANSRYYKPATVNVVDPVGDEIIARIVNNAWTSVPDNTRIKTEALTLAHPDVRALIDALAVLKPVALGGPRL
jgi:hypothetical protein